MDEPTLAPGLSPSTVPKVIDFGVAKATNQHPNGTRTFVDA